MDLKLTQSILSVESRYSKNSHKAGMSTPPHDNTDSLAPVPSAKEVEFLNKLLNFQNRKKILDQNKMAALDALVHQSVILGGCFHTQQEYMLGKSM